MHNKVTNYVELSEFTRVKSTKFFRECQKTKQCDKNNAINSKHFLNYCFEKS